MSDTLEIVLCFMIGVGAGTAYFALLFVAVRKLAAGHAIASLAPLHVGRLVGIVAVFWGVAHAGAVPLLATFLGFLTARSAVRHFTDEA